MKNLFKTVSVGGLSKYVWQNGAPNLHEDTMERVDELQKRTTLDQAKLDRIILQVDIEATNGFSKFENDFNNKKPNFTASDLDNLAKYTVSSSPNSEVYKMYRTEVISRINEFLLKEMGTGIPAKKAGELIEKCMKELPYRSGTIDKALWDAMTMVDEDRQGNKLITSITKKFQNKIERTKLARLMEKGEQNIHLGETFSFKKKEYIMTECEILTGAAMTRINPKLTSGLYLQNAIMLEGGKQIIAQLENGCEGNFVVIDVTEGNTPPPPPPPVIDPDPTFREYEDSDGEHWISGTRDHGRIATVGNQQYDELLKSDVNSRLLMENYEDASIAGLLTGLENIPVADREKALGDFFAVLGKSNPNQAAAAMKEFLSYMEKDAGALEQKIIDTFDDKISTAPTVDEKSVWEAMKQNFMLRQQRTAPAEAWGSLRDLYTKLKNVNIAKLPPELQELARGQLQGIEQSTTQMLAMDMIATSRRTLQSTFDEQENLEDFMKASTAEKKEMLTNEGFWHNSDGQDEVYFSSMQVLESLEYLLTYQYPTDLKAGKIVKNPIDYYLNELKSSKGAITAPAGAPTPSTNFIAFEDEMRMFEEYQNGSEKMGDNSIWNLYAGDKSAYSMLNTAKNVFSATNLMSAKGNLGSIELLRMSKIDNAIATKHYDEARALCIEVLEPKLKKPTKKELADKMKELSDEKKKKITAQVKLTLQGQGITSVSQLTAKGILDKTGRPYASLLPYIDERVTSILEEQTTIQLFGESAATISLTDPSLSDFDRQTLEKLQDLNGDTDNIFDLSAENVDYWQSIGKTVTEIIIVELATAGVGGLLSGVAGVTARGVSLGSRTMRASRAFSLERFGYSAGARIRGLVGLSKAGNTAGWANRFARGESFLARRGIEVLQGASFVEGQALLHGHLVDPTSPEGAWEIASMTGTFMALGQMQRLMRGQTMAMRAVNASNANRVQRFLGHENAQAVGNWMQRHMNNGGWRAGAVHTGEFAAEFAGFHYLTDVQEYLGVKAGMMTQDQVDAMAETNGWRRAGHELAVLAGLRTWRVAKSSYEGNHSYKKLLSDMKKEKIKFEPYQRVVKNEKLRVSDNKIVEIKKVEFLDKNGEKITRSIESEKNAIKRYISRLPLNERMRIKKYVKKISEMNSECRVSINIPAYMEGKDIYNFLTKYSKQVGKNGKHLDPKLYELNVIVNRPKGKSPDNSVEEIKRFKKDNPNINVNYIDVEFPVKIAGVGAARKLLTDITLERSLNRKNQDSNLYIESEDADHIRIDKKTVVNIISKMDGNPHLDAVRGVTDRAPEIMMKNDMFFINKRSYDFLETYLRHEKYRPHNNPNANFSWNRTITNGWNVAYSAEVYAKVGGYNSKMKVGEDMYIGEKISLLRGNKQKGKFIPETGTVGNVSSRTDSSPRRFLESFLKEKSAYDDFGDFSVEDAVRNKTDDGLLNIIKDKWGDRITEKNKHKLEGMLHSLYLDTKQRAPAESVDEIFNKVMFFTGFKKGDYHFSKEGWLKIDNLSSIQKHMDNYRKNPKYKIRYARQDAMGEV